MLAVDLISYMFWSVVSKINKKLVGKLGTSNVLSYKILIFSSGDANSGEFPLFQYMKGINRAE